MRRHGKGRDVGLSNEARVGHAGRSFVQYIRDPAVLEPFQLAFLTPHAFCWNDFEKHRILFLELAVQESGSSGVL
ncbi:hypothetical protein N7517_011614 [Penicillium concentricum]|uniref:Uncharacterized protein n=1 Tax=Penicillium concentricum TaxID=293559 RepID=A0A9W9RB46_9EURO|nr:uncharacterized protein N7517_011614 [Penicillium concentricum]KAJ5357005.1 hypothetical protein N7517_011614 [Penicillium concentricum]